MLDLIGHRAAMMLLGIFAALIAATSVTACLNWRSPNGNRGELNARMKSWWVIMALFTFAIVVNRAIAMVFFAFVSFTAFKEYYSLVPCRRVDRHVWFWAYLSIPLQYYCIGKGCYGLFIVLIPVFALLAIAARMILTGETRGFLNAVGTIQWGLMTCVFGLSHLAYLLVLPNPGSVVTGVSLLLYVVALTELNDVAQYIWGKSIGGPKIIPRVSPGKTWAGFLGGVVTTTVLAAFLGPWLTPLSLRLAVISGLLLSVAGFFGDLTESALKRDLGVKDTGALLPGHGGLLDRVDSLIFTAPLMFHFLRYFCYSGS